MIKSLPSLKASTSLLGAGLLVVSLGLPLAASAHDRRDDGHNGLAFLIGTAVGQVRADGYHGVRHVYHRHPERVAAWRRFHWRNHHDAWNRRFAPHQQLHWGEGHDGRRHDRDGDHARTRGRDRGDHDGTDRRHH